ncbi:MAG: alpha-galactosidase [Tyzzerella sp.]|nr:alpha-galactosidase [Tyzzerella sp.]
MILFENSSFYLETKNTSYVMRVLDNKVLSNAYYGKKIGRCNLNAFSLIRGIGYSPSIALEGKNVSPLMIPWEMPTYGQGNFGLPGISVIGADNRFVNELSYESYEIINGKPSIKGMPSFDTNVEDVQTLKITLRDKALNYRVILYYSVFEKEDVITRRTEIVNMTDEQILIKSASSAAIEFQSKKFQMTTLKGSWARERWIDTYDLHQGVNSVESRRGSSSHQLNPFMALSEKNTTEHMGDVYGFALVYSADFKISVEVNEVDSVRVIAGINPENFCWRLQAGESFETPECVLTYSADGFNGMSHNFHNLCRNHLGKCADKNVKHPIVINNWEATYFNFNDEKIIEFIKACKGLGIDTMVLDDGWFGHRDNDDSSLGDWFIDEKKFPNGLEKVIETCKSQGMNFGIWFEPEMISRDSDLFRAHPDWCIHTDLREPVESRTQLVLDYSRQEVVDYIFEVMDDFLSKNDISYVKWDMNRNITDNGSNWLGEYQGEFSHRNILGVYDLEKRLTEAHPDVFFEGCAGGGGRVDFGILYYMPQIWTSDDTDSIERLRIQYGTSLVYPPSTMSAHISAVPNHQTGRITPFKSRNDVAQMCNFGYELNVAKLPQKEIEQIPKQVEEHRGLEPLIQDGDYYRLLNPFTGKQCAWELVSEDKKKAYVMLAAVNIAGNDTSYYVKPRGLNPEFIYQINDTDIIADGETIMNVGIPVVEPLGEYETRTFYLTKI